MFSSSECRSLSRGSWQVCTGLLAGMHGQRSLAFLYRLSLSLSWAALSRSHAPPLQGRDPAFSGTGEGKGPGRRDRWGAFPPQGCCAGTLNDSLSLPGRGGGGPCAGQQSAPGASERWRPLRHEHSALQSCGNLISLKGLLSAKTWALGQALGVQFGKAALNLILKEGPV